MRDEIAGLHRYLGDVPPEISVLKVAAEAGEAAQALLGMNQAWSPRKGANATKARDAA
jgi:hypothetical protein